MTTPEEWLYITPSFFHPSSAPPGFIFAHDEALESLREAITDTNVDMPALVLLNWIATILPAAGCEAQFEAWLHDGCAMFDALPDAGYPQSVPFRYIAAVSKEGWHSIESLGGSLKDATQACRETFGPAHPNTVVCRLYECWHDLYRAQDSQILDALEQCLLMCQERDRNSRLLKINCQVMLGRALTEAGQMEAARETYRRVLKESVIQLTPLRMYRAMVVARLADLEGNTWRLSGATPEDS